MNEMVGRNKDAVVEVNAHDLYQALAIAQGYRMMHGNLIDTSVIYELEGAIYEAGYEEFNYSLLDYRAGRLEVRPELCNDIREA